MSLCKVRRTSARGSPDWCGRRVCRSNRDRRGTARRRPGGRSSSSRQGSLARHVPPARRPQERPSPGGRHPRLTRTILSANFRRRTLAVSQVGASSRGERLLPRPDGSSSHRRPAISTRHPRFRGRADELRPVRFPALHATEACGGARRGWPHTRGAGCSP
jgi:hypothetical protein